MLTDEFLKTLKQSGCSRPKVLDLCCGKGGDLLKWRNGNISYLVATGKMLDGLLIYVLVKFVAFYWYFTSQILGGDVPEFLSK